MRLFYPTPATFPERKRKLRQCPEKLRTIGKSLSLSFFCTPPLITLLCACAHKNTQQLFSHTQTRTRTGAHTEPSFCCLGWVLCFGLSNKHCHAYTVNSAARALYPVRTHARSRTRPPRTRKTTVTPGLSRFPREHLPSCTSRCVRVRRNAPTIPHADTRTHTYTHLINDVLSVFPL